MSTPQKDKLDAMLAEFSAAHPAAGKQLKSLIDGTPELRARMVDAIEAGNLTGFAPLPKQLVDQGVLASYQAEHKEIRVPLEEIARSGTNKTLANAFRCTLVHETEHAVHRDELKKVAVDFETKVEKIALSKQPHDYTQAIADYMAAVRPNEARDQIAAANVMAAHVMREHPNATREQFCRHMYESAPQMKMLFEATGQPPNVAYRPKDGIELGKDFKIAETPQNVEAFGKHYFDKLDYRQLYGERCIKMAASYESWAQQQTGAKSVQAYVDLKALGIDASKTSLPEGFHNGHAPGTQLHKPGKAGRGGPDADGYEWEPAMFQQSFGALQRSGIALEEGIDPRAMAAGVAVKAQCDGLREINTMLPSRDGVGVISVQGDPTSACAKTSYITKQDAVKEPVENNLTWLREREAVPAVERTPQTVAMSMSGR